MRLLPGHARTRFPELSYAGPEHPFLKRCVIRTIEVLSGRNRYAGLYDRWRTEIVPEGRDVFSRMLGLIGISLICDEVWPPADLPAGPVVIVANHPFGIGDGIAVLSLAERLGRPFRVMIHSDLLRVREMEPYSLAVDFGETRDATARNLEMRREAVRLLREGVTVVVFPAGGVATAQRGFGRADDLPWKMFPARLVREASASVIPIYFAGQNGVLFQMASRVSMTLRLSLLIREFTRLAGGTITARIGPVIPWSEMEATRDRRALTERLHGAVFALRRSSARADRGGNDTR